MDVVPVLEGSGSVGRVVDVNVEGGVPPLGGLACGWLHEERGAVEVEGGRGMTEGYLRAG